jgi:hypothetical protein
MHHQRLQPIDDKARVWVVMRGQDGRLHEQLDPSRVDYLHPSQSAQEVADALTTIAGELEIASSRLW